MIKFGRFVGLKTNFNKPGNLRTILNDYLNQQKKMIELKLKIKQNNLGSRPFLP